MRTSPTKLRHIVLFGFKAGVGAAEADEVVARFRALRTLIPGIEAFEWGVNNSPEGLSQDHTHCFTLTFATEAARDAYLPHPKHREFVEWVGAFVEKAFVADYWAQA
jgi:hypothetical protein